MTDARTHHLTSKLRIAAATTAVALAGGAVVTGGPASAADRAVTGARAAAVPSQPPQANWSAGPVALRTGSERPGGSERVREVQRRLRLLEYRPGRVDGRFGRRTRRAVLAFQRDRGLRPDGIVAASTLRALRSSTLRALRSSSDAPDARPHPSTTVRRDVPSPERQAGAGTPSPDLIFVFLTLTVLLAAAGVALRARGRNGDALPLRAVLPLLAAPAAPATRRPSEGAVAGGRPGPRVGALLQEAGALSDDELADALAEQTRSGGRLGDILVAHGVVPPAALTTAIARQLGVETLQDADQPVELLSADEARTWRAVPLARDDRSNGAAPVALADPTTAVLGELEIRLGRPVEPRLCDDAALDELLSRLYATADADEVTRVLREAAPDLSAFRTALSRPQTLVACVLGFALVLGLLADLQLTATVLVGIATTFFVTSTGFRLYAARQGSLAGATIDPPPAELAAMDDGDLPPYTVLLPLYKEKPSTVRALFESLSAMDYPKHKLDGLLLIEDDDDATRAAIEQVGRPPWMRILSLPPGVPRTKPRAMGIGLRYARGTFVTVYDAEDKPDPAQLKKAVWGFAQGDASLACLQGKLGYYNPRQNLLTRWFTLEYDAWFNIFLPGLHRIGAPIPLGGTSNHFRRPALEACLGWDPYNVTEDADLGLRFARLGFTTGMLESTTLEEANSRVPNWLRQRSRWMKGYMQTVLVHTRRPLTLLRDLGPGPTAAFLLTIGGAVVTALLAPVFWLLLILWILFEPAWIAALFPGPVYYAASVSLVLGNFALVFLSLVAAVRRGHDDLAPHALLIPFYWVLMSAATYVALVELLVRPHHWHKTEHALHLAEEPA